MGRAGYHEGMKFSSWRLGFCAALLLGGAAGAAAPENLARSATASATSEHNQQYLAKFATDGKIPEADGHADLSAAWCVQGQTHRNGAEFSLTWPAPVTVGEIVYYGRTAWMVSECWKDFQVFLDDAAAPVVTGKLEETSAPQRIKLPAPTQARKLTLKFTSSYGGLNPGASEIMVFAAPTAAGSLPGEMPPPAAVDLKSLKLGFDKLLVIQRHPIRSSHVYTYHTEGFSPGGDLFVWSTEGGLRRLVDAGQGQMLDCDVSFDGKVVLFSWRKSKDEGYHLFTINADGTGLRQLTDGRWHDYNACWLPDGGIAFLSSRAARFAYCWVSPVGLLHRMDADGKNVRRLSANIVNDFTPSLLNDGRIIYSRWEYVDKPAIPIQSLWAINPDGTGLTGYYGNRVLSPATFMEARSIPGTTKVLCTLTAHNGPASGAIGIVDRARGANAQEAIQNLTPEINIGKVDQGSGNHIKGPYSTPYPLDGRRYLVSKNGAIFLRDYAGTEEALVLAPRAGLGFFNAQPLAPRVVPPLIPSALPDKTSTTGWATLFMQDVYNGLAPHVRRSEVVELAVIQEMEKPVRVDVKNRAFGFQFPVISCGATYAGKKVWGYVPVEPDGSACFKVPAGVPIYFMALDAEGRAVQRMRTFTHLMPGEKQACIGCHADRSSAAQPTRRATATAPRELRAPEWGQGVGFDYTTVIQPILDRHCIACHSGATPPKRVDLCGDKTDFFSVSYESLARGRKRIGEGEVDSPYVNWIPTYNGLEANILEVTPKAWGSPRSKLAELLLAGHPDAAGKPRVQLAAAERRQIFQWIDLNIPYYGTTEPAYPDARGCRQIYPADLDKTLAEVATRRCATCHDSGKIPREVWTRITNPQMNRFLLAPLAKTAGGSEACGKIIFADKNDPDYQTLLRTFEPLAAMLKAKPRDDMPGSRPDPGNCRDMQ